MRKMDHSGLLLAEYQGKLFEKSCELDCSSAVFIRRFYHSELLRKLDQNNTTSVPLDVNDGMESITRQFGKTNYGQTKYSSSALFWMGYMYRYISYTREQPTQFVMKLFNHKQMNEVYYSFHTQDPEWCVRSLLELNGFTEEIFDNNLRLKAVIKTNKEAKLVCPS